jgi:hypothetical protein
MLTPGFASCAFLGPASFPLSAPKSRVRDSDSPKPPRIPRHNESVSGDTVQSSMTPIDLQSQPPKRRALSYNSAGSASAALSTFLRRIASSLSPASTALCSPAGKPRSHRREKTRAKETHNINSLCSAAPETDDRRVRESVGIRRRQKKRSSQSNFDQFRDGKQPSSGLCWVYRPGYNKFEVSDLQPSRRSRCFPSTGIHTVLPSTWVSFRFLVPPSGSNNYKKRRDGYEDHAHAVYISVGTSTIPLKSSSLWRSASMRL